MKNAGNCMIESVAPSQEQAAGTHGYSRQAWPRLLIVDDDPDITSLLMYTLTRARFVPAAAADGASALKIMADSRPDLVSLDWMLPEMSGIELLRRMRQEERLSAIPVIMLTARAAEVDRVHGLERITRNGCLPAGLPGTRFQNFLPTPNMTTHGLISRSKLVTPFTLAVVSRLIYQT